MIAPMQLLVALPAEAKPLIRAYALRRLQPDGDFPRYANRELQLTLTGPGNRAAGDALEYLRELLEPEPRHWINLGIAGHARLAPGDCLLAEGVTDEASGRHWRLQPFADLPDTSLGELRCVSAAERCFDKAAGYDMESAAIAGHLAAWDQLSRLHILKVVSDNPDHPSRHISGRMVGELITRRLPTLEALINRLRTHAQTC